MIDEIRERMSIFRDIGATITKISYKKNQSVRNWGIRK